MKLKLISGQVVEIDPNKIAYMARQLDYHKFKMVNGTCYAVKAIIDESAHKQPPIIAVLKSALRDFRIKVHHPFVESLLEQDYPPTTKQMQTLNKILLECA